MGIYGALHLKDSQVCAIIFNYKTEVLPLFSIGMKMLNLYSTDNRIHNILSTVHLCHCLFVT